MAENQEELQARLAATEAKTQAMMQEYISIVEKQFATEGKPFDRAAFTKALDSKLNDAVPYTDNYAAEDRQINISVALDALKRGDSSTVKELVASIPQEKSQERMAEESRLAAVEAKTQAMMKEYVDIVAAQFAKDGKTFDRAAFTKALDSKLNEPVPYSENHATEDRNTNIGAELAMLKRGGNSTVNELLPAKAEARNSLPGDIDKENAALREEYLKLAEERMGKDFNRKSREESLDKKLAAFGGNKVAMNNKLKELVEESRELNAGESSRVFPQAKPAPVREPTLGEPKPVVEKPKSQFQQLLDKMQTDGANHKPETVSAFVDFVSSGGLSRVSAVEVQKVPASYFKELKSVTIGNEEASGKMSAEQRKVYAAAFKEESMKQYAIVQEQRKNPPVVAADPYEAKRQQSRQIMQAVAAADGQPGLSDYDMSARRNQLEQALNMDGKDGVSRNDLRIYYAKDATNRVRSADEVEKIVDRMSADLEKVGIHVQPDPELKKLNPTREQPAREQKPVPRGAKIADNNPARESDGVVNARATAQAIYKHGGLGADNLKKFDPKFLDKSLDTDGNGLDTKDLERIYAKLDPKVRDAAVKSLAANLRAAGVTVTEGNPAAPTNAPIVANRERER